MSKRNFHLLLHPLFVASIILLLLNDLVFKYTFSNWFTGKLSDVVGLFAFGIFWIAFFPAHKKQVLWCCAVFFIWWKSGLSQPVIDTINNRFHLGIGRTIDYTDFIALPILLAAYYFTSYPFSNRTYQLLWVNLSCILSVFAFCNTSAPRYGFYSAGNDNYEYVGVFSSSKTEAEILNELTRTGVSFYKDSVVYIPLENFTRHYNSYNYQPDEWQLVMNKKDSTLFRKEIQAPFYIIPQYVIEGNKIKNIQFRINKYDGRNKFKSSVDVRFLQALPYSEYRNGKHKKLYNKHFRNLLN